VPAGRAQLIERRQRRWTLAWAALLAGSAHGTAIPACPALHATTQPQLPQERTAREQRQRREARTAAGAGPLRRYLLQMVMPTVTAGLTQCVVDQPPDPVQV
jgi:hypothetical protein